MLVGVKCPAKGLVSSEECRACALCPLHPCPYTPDMLAMMRRENDTEPDGLSFTPSRLLDCARKQFLMAATDYYIDVKQAYPMLRGHMVHALFEHHGSYPGALLTVREIRLAAPIQTRYGTAQMEQTFGQGPYGHMVFEPDPDEGAQLFAGKPDLVVATDLDEQDVLHLKVVDYKSKAEIRHDLTTAVAEHQMQVNMYAYLVERDLLTNPKTVRLLVEQFGEPPAGVVVDELEIVYLDMKRVRRFTSAGTLYDDGRILQRTPQRVYEQLELAPITLLPMERVEKFIRARIEERLAGREKLPPVLPPAEAWRCNYCSVSERCAEVAAEEREGDEKEAA